MSIRRLTGDFGFYGILLVVQRSVSVLLLPIYTRVISQQDFGNLDTIIAACGFLSLLMNLHLAQGFIRLFPEYDKRGEGGVFAGTNLIAQLVLGVGLCLSFIAAGLLGFITFDFVPPFGGLRAVWILAVFNGFLSLVGELLLVHARMLLRRRLFAAGALMSSVVTAAATILFVVPLKFGILGVTLGQLVAGVATIGIMLVGLRSAYRFRFDFKMLLNVLKYSLPIMPGFCLGFSSAYIGKFFIYGSLGAADVAILAICYKITTGLSFFTLGFRMAWQPVAMAYIGEERNEEYYTRSMRAFLVVTFAGIVATVATAKYLVWFLAPANYHSATVYVPLFTIAMGLLAAGDILQLGNQIAKKTIWISITALCGLSANVGVLTMLVGKYQLYAVPLGLLLSGLITATVAYVSSQRNYFIRYDHKAFMIFGCGCFAVWSVSLLMNRFHDAVCLVLLIGIGILTLWGLTTKDERYSLRQAVTAYVTSSLRLGRERP